MKDFTDTRTPYEIDLQTKVANGLAETLAEYAKDGLPLHVALNAIADLASDAAHIIEQENAQ